MGGKSTSFINLNIVISDKTENYMINTIIGRNQHNLILSWMINKMLLWEFPDNIQWDDIETWYLFNDCLNLHGDNYYIIDLSVCHPRT